ncbi:MAG: efflux RND transporter periplasmic adaptor subunit, partial [Terriglobales bacterium]
MPPRRRKWLGRSVLVLLLVAGLAGAGWEGWRLLAGLGAPAQVIPITPVRRGDVRLQVYAQGTLKGGHSEMLVAPPVAGGPMSIKFLLDNGVQVKPGDEVVAFDTAAQQYNLTQAQEAVEQAQQQVLQAQATAAAQDVDDGYQLAKANFDVQRAQLQVKQDPIKAVVDAKKNDLALAAAQAHLAQLQKDVASRKAGNAASIAVQQAAQHKAQADAATAEHNIASMTLRAHQPGYVSIRQNTSTNILFAGMALPGYQIGDTARPGQAVVEIPDTSSWEVDLNVSELDAGHLAPGEAVQVQFVALPGQVFEGKLQSIGAASGEPWNRTVAIVVELLHPTPALRPGLSANAVVTTGVLRNVLWAPSQAEFELAGKSTVFVRRNGQFERQPVAVVQR